MPHKYLGSRWTQAYYNHIGITDLIAKNIENYIELAIKVATNKLYCSELRTKIKENSHKLFYSDDASKCWGNMFLDLYEKEQNKYIENDKIPKIIIQTWKNSNLSPKLKYLSDKIKTLHPNFEYKFFTDKDIDKLLQINAK